MTRTPNQCSYRTKRSYTCMEETPKRDMHKVNKSRTMETLEHWNFGADLYLQVETMY